MSNQIADDENEPQPTPPPRKKKQMKQKLKEQQEPTVDEETKTDGQSEETKTDGQSDNSPNNKKTRRKNKFRWAVCVCVRVCVRVMGGGSVICSPGHSVNIYLLVQCM